MSSTLNEVVKISDTGFIDSINSLDLRVDNNTKLFINSSGNVGIGTDLPSSTLNDGFVPQANIENCFIHSVPGTSRVKISFTSSSNDTTDDTYLQIIARYSV